MRYPLVGKIKDSNSTDAEMVVSDELKSYDGLSQIYRHEVIHDMPDWVRGKAGLGPKSETASLDSSFIEWRESHEPVSKDVYEGVQGRCRSEACIGGLGCRGGSRLRGEPQCVVSLAQRASEICSEGVS
jgi:hypothetical protein